MAITIPIATAQRRNGTKVQRRSGKTGNSGRSVAAVQVQVQVQRSGYAMAQRGMITRLNAL